MPGKNSKFSKIDFTLFIRSMRCCEKWWQCRRYCDVSSISKLQDHRGFMQSWKLCRNLCSLRWLKPKPKRFKNFNPTGSNILNKLLLKGRMNDRSLLLNIDSGSEFLIVSSDLYESFRVEGKNRILETVCTTVKDWHKIYPCSSSLLNFWSQMD